jgi:hypothetical protein
MLKTAYDLGCMTDRALAMAFDRIVTRGVGAGLSWLTQAAGPLRTAAQRAFAIAELGFRDLVQFKVSVGLSSNGNFTPQTHAALVGELRQQGRAIVPTPEDLIARMIPASVGPVRQRPHRFARFRPVAGHRLPRRGKERELRASEYESSVKHVSGNQCCASFRRSGG